MAAVLLYVCSACVVWVCCFLPPVQADSVRCPSSCVCLGNNVDCSNLGLIEIPKDIPGWVTRLELQSNSIQEIRPDDLKGLHNLQYLDMSHNNLKVINGSVFRDLTGLQTLKLDSNELTEIPLFPSPLNITELTLTQNHVVTIPILAIMRMPELLTMDLSNNYILSITNGSFPAGSKLTHLTLNNNQISALEKGSMSNLTFLETLKINKNKLTELQAGVFDQLRSLKALELMRNKIRSIRGLTFQGLNELQVLKLKRNSISVLKDGAFWGLPNLINLQMDHNDIGNVTKAWTFGLKMLKILSLSHNKISKIEPGAWEECRNLDKLDLTHNKLTALTKTTLSKLTSLDTLLLDHNQISRIDDGAFRDLEELGTLEINSNEISWTMEDISGAFRGLIGLTKLGLRSNAIRSIAVHAFSSLPKLRHLYLEENDITSVQENAFETLRDLRDLRFNTSKLFCDCHLAWLPVWLKQIGFQHSAVGTCSHPPVLRGASILNVDIADFKCNNDEFPKPVILEHPQSANGFKGGNMTLTCVTAITGNSQPRIIWKKDNEIQDESLSEVTASSDGDVKRFTSNLYLQDIQDDMAGRYQCMVSNDFGSAFSQRAYINVYVFPVFLKKPKDVTVKAGKPAELKCAATGQPAPVISWQKDGGDNFPAARERRMQVYPNDDRFYIMNTRPADEGVYSCKARNEAGVVVANATVTVLETPDFVQPMQGKKSTKKGETTVLQCMASGSPQPKLTWLKDDKELVMTDRFFFTVDNQILVIVDTQWSDAGTYACRMSNSLGTARGTTELQVLSASGEVAEASGGSFGLDDESTTTGIIIIAVVCCVVGTSLVWVIIIYQTRKRHEVYSATPTDETTLPGEVPSSGYMSSDKEGSYSQGPMTMAGYHYQDYQMKESGYESSSGQFRANGYIRPAIYPGEVDEDDHHPPTMTAGDRLLRQMKAGNSVSSLHYPASDGDTIGSRHSTSSGQHSGSSDPPSSHSGQSGHSPTHHQLHVVTSGGDDHRQNPSPSLNSPASDEPREYASLRSSQQLVSSDGRQLFQTFHPTKPTNHDRLGNTLGSRGSCKGEDSDRGLGCGGRDKHRHHSDSCDNRDVESSSLAVNTSQPHCSACLSGCPVVADSNAANGRLNAHGEIQPNNHSVCRLHGTMENNGKIRTSHGSHPDNVGCSNRHLCSDKSKPPPPYSSVLPQSSSSLSSSHPHIDSKQRPSATHARGRVNKNKKVMHTCGSDTTDNKMSHCTQHMDTVPPCDCNGAVAGPSLSLRKTPTPSSSSRVSTPSPCCCEVVRDAHYCPSHQVHQGEEGTDNAGLASCSNCRCQHHYNHHPPHHSQQQHYPPGRGSSPAIARSRSSSSVGRDPMYYAHFDPCSSSVHTDCGSCGCENKDSSLQNQPHVCNHLSCQSCRNHQQGEKPLADPSSRIHRQGRLVQGQEPCRVTSPGRSSSVTNVPSSTIPATSTHPHHHSKPRSGGERTVKT